MLTAAILTAALLARTDPIGGSRKLVWQDEFDGSGAVDSAKWDFEQGYVRNHEEQEYVSELANAKVQDGNLVITAERGSGHTRSAALESKQFWRYGYFEIRAQFPAGRGTWPAIWFLGEGIRKPGDANIGWPNCGEIDLMENVGFNPNDVHFTVHTAQADGHGHASKGTHITVEHPWTDFHVYGLDWTKGHLDFYFDRKKVFSYGNDGVNPWPFDKPEFILLNLAIGGDWGGAKGVDPAIFPSLFKIDYVRVYQ